jgi:predicted dehydrogenase/aryl-alcohol dehydrogenase-like predicted oxidoreductase
MAEPLAWGILGAGRIARAFAQALAHSRTGRLAAVGSRDQAKAEAFAKEFGGVVPHGGYEALLADPGVRAVYIATPHPMHARWAIRAAEAGKHILCEKPLALNWPEAMAVVEAARERGVFLLEAFMYRCHPQTARLVDLLRSKAIGDVRVIRATFSFHAGFNAEGRLFANALGGGGILDVGCYCASMARLAAGVALGLDGPAEPLEVKGCGRLGPTGVDEWAIASLRFPGDILAQLSTGVQVQQDNTVQIFGSEGSITVPWPWTPAREGGATKLLVQKKGAKEPEEVRVETPEWLYAIEADTVAANLDRRQAPFPAMTWADTLGNMRTLDLWREAIGLQYDSEKIGAGAPPVHGRPLRVRPDAPIPRGRIEGLAKPVARLVMGVDNQKTMPIADVLFDDYYERGGNAFDTAYIYGGGTCERVLGQWIKDRGLRRRIVILDKGAHTPHCDPESLTRQLLESLDRLQTDYIDIYMMHRDNPDVPVGEFVAVLNEHRAAGRIRVFGGSNWGLRRLEAAQRYARRRGLAGFAAVSNNFSLVRMVDPVWAGCLQSSTPEWRRWLAKHQFPLMPWSSQARGFFTDRAGPEKRTDKELVRCWYSDDNFRRRERAMDLAARRGVAPIAVALAYVLRQPFPTFPLIGPRTLEEFHTSLGALGVDLSPEDLAWLNLEA